MVDRKSLGSLRLRVAAAVVGIVVILGALHLGAVPFALVVATISAFALNEFYALFREKHQRPNEVLGVVAGVSFPLGAVLAGKTGLVSALFLAAAATALWYLVFPKTKLTDMAVTLFGAVYIGFMLSFLVLVQALNHGTWLVMLVLGATWINDTAAYFAGVTLGRRRLAPNVSPGKTWEGTVVGVGLTTLALGAMVFVTYLDTIERLILGGVVATAAIGGDLAESRIKRELGVKDAGKLIPGHGGFLDRFDSLLLVSGTSYYLLTVLFKLR